MGPASCASLLPPAMFTPPGPCIMPEEVRTHLAASARCWGLPRTACRQISLACSQWMDVFLPWARRSARTLCLKRGTSRNVPENAPEGRGKGRCTDWEQPPATSAAKHQLAAPRPPSASLRNSWHGTARSLPANPALAGRQEVCSRLSTPRKQPNPAALVARWVTLPLLSLPMSLAGLYRQCAAWSAGKPGILRGAGPSAPPKNSLAACRAHQCASR